MAAAGAGPLGARLADLVDPADEDTSLARLHAAGLTDGLPVVVPTPARLAAFSAAAPPVRWPGGVLALAPGPPSPADLVAVAVMAGLPPAGLPVLHAALAATTQPAFNALGVQTTTSSVAPFVAVHGWPGAAPVGAAGRAVALGQRLLGGALAGVADVSTQRPPPGVGWCVVEDPASPWPTPGPAVSVAAAVGWAELVLGLDDVDDDLFALVAAIGGVAIGRRPVVAVLPPEAATRLAAAGWDPARLQVEAPRLSLVVVAGGVGVKAVVLPVWPASEVVRAPLA